MEGVLIQLLRGMVLGSLVVHASGLWRPIGRIARDPSVLVGLSDSQQLALALSCLIALSAEPLIYLFVVIKGVERWGWLGMLLLAPLILTHVLSWLLTFIRVLPYKLLVKDR